jgi:hypothetical protein
MSTFVLENGENGWWELVGNTCYNRVGGRHEYYPQDKDVFAEANDWDELDYSYLIKPDSEYGWVSPDGRFYGCKYADHSLMAKMYFKKSERQLEEEGWVKIFRDSYDRKPTWMSDKLMITGAQRITLESRGLQVDPDVCELTVPIQGGANG